MKSDSLFDPSLRLSYNYNVFFSRFNNRNNVFKTVRLRWLLTFYEVLCLSVIQVSIKGHSRPDPYAGRGGQMQTHHPLKSTALLLLLLFFNKSLKFMRISWEKIPPDSWGFLLLPTVIKMQAMCFHQLDVWNYTQHVEPKNFWTLWIGSRDGNLFYL